MQVHVGVVVGLARVAVDADDDTLLPLHLALVAEGRLLELALHKALFDGAHAPAQLVYAPDVLPRFLLDGVGERLDVVGAGQGVGCAGQASFVRQDLLGAERDAGAPLGREREGFVEGVGVQALGPTHDGRERLHRRADDVVLGLLGGERGAGRLDVEAELMATLLGRPEALLNDLRPHPTSSPVLGDLLEEVVVGVKEKGEARGEVVHLEPGVERGPDVGDSVGEGEGELLHRSRAGLAYVVAGDRDRVPPRQLIGAVGEGVGRYPHGGLRRVDVGTAREVLLEDVVLRGPRDVLRFGALLLGDERVEEKQDRSRSVDRHRGRDLAQGNAVEKFAHVEEGVYGDADLADLAKAKLVVGVAAHLGGRSKATERPVWPFEIRYLKRALVSLAVPKPAYWRMVHGLPRYMLG